MSQFSVYLRFCAGKEQAYSYTRKVEHAVPSRGRIHIVHITDKQYENIVSFDGRTKEPARKNPEQYVLF